MVRWVRRDLVNATRICSSARERATTSATKPTGAMGMTAKTRIEAEEDGEIGTKEEADVEVVVAEEEDNQIVKTWVTAVMIAEG